MKKIFALSISLVTLLTTIKAQNEVVIGSQIWSSNNLNVDHFRNGDLIPEARTNEEWKAYGDAGEPAWCYYENNSSNGKKYGKLYNFYAVNDYRGLAPRGWHIPTDYEWTQLTNYLSGEELAGAKMKSNSDWGYDDSGTNSSGFNGLPGGFRYLTGAFSSIGNGGGWWSTTEYESNTALGRSLRYNMYNVRRATTDKPNGFSVRCLRD